MDLRFQILKCRYYPAISCEMKPLTGVFVVILAVKIDKLNFQGRYWWGIPFIGYLVRGADRPKLFEIRGGRDILVENMSFVNSPRWTFWVHYVDGLEVRNCEISARRTNQDRHDLIDMSAFNTDGFDVRSAQSSLLRQ